MTLPSQWGLYIPGFRFYTSTCKWKKGPYRRTIGRERKVWKWFREIKGTSESELGREKHPQMVLYYKRKVDRLICVHFFPLGAQNLCVMLRDCARLLKNYFKISYLIFKHSTFCLNEIRLHLSIVNLSVCYGKIWSASWIYLTTCHKHNKNRKKPSLSALIWVLSFSDSSLQNCRSEEIQTAPLRRQKSIKNNIQALKHFLHTSWCSIYYIFSD